MRQVTFFCDRCGTEIDRLYSIIGHEVDKVTGDYIRDEGVELDFCEDCYHKIMSDMTEVHGEWDEEVGELPFMDPVLDQEDNFENKEIDEKIKRRLPFKEKVIDMGKVKALREAGWLCKDIAVEMGVSTSTLSKKMKKEGIR